MKKIVPALVLLIALLALGLGCSSDDNPVNPDNETPAFSDTTVWNSTDGVWQTTIDASSYDQAAYFSFSAATGTPKLAATNWDLSFMRTNINLNGGASSEDGGAVVGANLGQVNYDDVTIADTAGATWVEDQLYSVINEWLTYNPVTHELGMTKYVYSMMDAEGDNYIKFRIDSIVGAGQPPSMGTVWMTYYYQPTANSRDLSGQTQTASINVGSGTGYFDFSSGSQVTPANPGASTDWDLAFSSYEIMQNCGPNGPGDCVAWPAYTELTGDPTDIDAFTTQPSDAPMFPDFIKSVFVGDLVNENENWYDYDGTTHQISSSGNIYLVKVGDVVYKLSIESYYGNVDGVPTSAHYTFVWNEL